jgi:hypothetical protein
MALDGESVHPTQGRALIVNILLITGGIPVQAVHIPGVPLPARARPDSFKPFDNRFEAMSQDELLPQPVRLMTDDGLRFVASYRGMINFATKVRNQGGPHADKWGLAAKNVALALEAEDESGIRAAIQSFSMAARHEGWVG